MLSTKVKEARAVAKASEEGKLAGHYSEHKRKPLDESFREHLGKFIDKLTPKDMIDVVAAIGLTPIVYSSVKDIESITATVTTLFGKAEKITNPLGNLVLNPNPIVTVGAGIGIEIWNLISGFINPKKSITETASPQDLLSSGGEVFQWLLAFSISWCIVKFGDKLINAGIVGIGDIVGLLGVTAAAA